LSDFWQRTRQVNRLSAVLLTSAGTSSIHYSLIIPDSGPIVENAALEE
jgi:hypothetical protein